MLMLIRSSVPCVAHDAAREIMSTTSTSTPRRDHRAPHKAARSNAHSSYVDEMDDTAWWSAMLAPMEHRLRSRRELYNAPYPHMILSSFFSRRLYDKLVRHFPDDREPGSPWVQNNGTARCRRGGLCEQWSIGSKPPPTQHAITAEDEDAWWPFRSWHEPLESPRRRFWRGLFRTLNSDAVRAAFLSAFHATISRRFPRGASTRSARAAEHDEGGEGAIRDWATATLRNESVHMSIALRRSAAGYALEPHTDICDKLVSWVLFVPETGGEAARVQAPSAATVLHEPPHEPPLMQPASSATTIRAQPSRQMYAKPEHTPYGGSGTAVYMPTPAAPIRSTRCGETRQTFAGYREVGRAPYAHNSMFAFASCATSWHGVASAAPRRSIFLFLTYPSKLAKGGTRERKRGADGKFVTPPPQAACPV